ncbi:unnamed protein product, partial [Prorocentrum cordatum]
NQTEQLAVESSVGAPAPAPPASAVRGACEREPASPSVLGDDDDAVGAIAAVGGSLADALGADFGDSKSCMGDEEGGADDDHCQVDDPLEREAGAEGDEDAVQIIGESFSTPRRKLRPHVSACSEFEPRNLAEHMVRRWLTELGPEVEIDCINGLRSFASKVPEGIAARWSLFAGSGVGTHFYSALQTVLNREFGIEVVFDTTVYSELNPEKQQHIMDQFSPRFLVGDVKKLKSPSSDNDARGGTEELLPWCFILDAGPPCTSRTPLSCRRAANLGCVQESREATGVGFNETLSVIKQHWPTIVHLECVKELNQEGGVQQDSDASWVTSELKKMGYWAHHGTLDSCDFGAYPRRVRTYWTGMLHMKGSPDEIAHHFNRVLVACRLPNASDADNPKTWPCIETNDEFLKRMSTVSGIPLWSDFGVGRESKSKKDDPNWKHEHREIFQANGIQWPFDHAAPPVGGDVIHRSGMLPREFELAVMSHVLFPMAIGTQMEFFDVNQSTQRTIKRHLDEDTYRPKSVTGDAVAPSPWSSRPPTLVGSMTMIVRYRSSGVVHVRAVEPIELFTMIGWDATMWKRRNDQTKDFSYLDMISNMAGNAYSLFHLGPWAIASLSTFGRFYEPSPCAAQGDSGAP